jgi:hypothetical protein
MNRLRIVFLKNYDLKTQKADFSNRRLVEYSFKNAGF